MTDKEFEGKTVAPLHNVKLAMRSLEVALGRPEHLPGFVGLYGFAGFGKTTAALYCANKYNAYCISVKSTEISAGRDPEGDGDHSGEHHPADARASL